jgi:hypothetical protein
VGVFHKREMTRAHAVAAAKTTNNICAAKTAIRTTHTIKKINSNRNIRQAIGNNMEKEVTSTPTLKLEHLKVNSGKTRAALFLKK